MLRLFANFAICSFAAKTSDLAFFYNGQIRYNHKDILEYWAKVSNYQTKSRCTLRRRMGDVINHDNNHERHNYSSFSYEHLYLCVNMFLVLKSL